MMGLSLIFTSWGLHKFGYDFETLALVLRRGGFEKVIATPYLGSSVPDLNREQPNEPRAIASLCVEAVR